MNKARIFVGAWIVLLPISLQAHHFNPDEWTQSHLGDPPLSEISVSEDRLCFLLNASGAGVRGDADEAAFVFQRMRGTFSLLTQVRTFEGGGEGSTIGVMIRASTAPDSPHIYAGLSRADENLVYEQVYRQNAGQMATTSRPGEQAFTPLLPDNVWLRVDRFSGGQFAASFSHDIIHWVQLERISIEMPEIVLVGVLAASPDGEPLSASVCKPETFGGEAVLNAGPVAVIEASMLEGYAPLEISFDASESHDPDGEIVDYIWDFGEESPSRGMNITHVFEVPGTQDVELTVVDDGGHEAHAHIEIVVRSTDAVRFLRGDVDGDGAVDLSDAIASLGALFLGAERPACPDAADSNDSGDINISDPIFTLSWLFLGGISHPPPGESSCGIDPTDDLMSVCASDCQ